MSWEEKKAGTGEGGLICWGTICLFADNKAVDRLIVSACRYHDTIERYCDETDTWEIVGEMPTSRSWLSCVSLQLRKDIHMSSCPGTPNDN